MYWIFHIFWNDNSLFNTAFLTITHPTTFQVTRFAVQHRPRRASRRVPVTSNVLLGIRYKLMRITDKNVILFDVNFEIETEKILLSLNAT